MAAIPPSDDKVLRKLDWIRVCFLSSRLNPPHMAKMFPGSSPLNSLIKSGFFPLLFGLFSFALLEVLLWPPVPNFPWAVQMVLTVLGSTLIASPIFILLLLFPANRLLSQLCGPKDSNLRQGRCFALGLVIATPPVSWVISPLILLTMLISFWEKPAVILLARLSGFAGLIAGLIAVWVGPVQNWRQGSDLPPLVLNTANFESTIQPSPETPDILLISLDTVRADALVGENSGDVPFFDHLREQGAWAEWALSSSNRTVPGHAGMLTGLGALWHGLTNNNQMLPEDKQTLAETYSARGYRTIGLINNPLLRSSSGFDQGYSDYDDLAVRQISSTKAFFRQTQHNTWLGWVLPSLLYKKVILRALCAQPNESKPVVASKSLGGVATERAEALLEQAYQEDRAFFFFLHFNDAHAPYAAPIGFSNRRGGTDPRDRYLEEIEFLDHCIKRVVERMEQSGRPFVLCLTADHGEHFEEHGLTGHSNSLYNELVRVPMLFYGSGVAKGQTLKNAALMDVAPTLLARSGLSMQSARGRNLLAEPAWEASDDYFQFLRDVNITGAFLGPYKWISPKGWEQSSALDGKVYLWMDDPAEQNPLDMDSLPFEEQERLMKLLAEAPSVNTSRFTGAEAIQHIEMLKELGYMEDAARGAESLSVPD